MGRTPVSPVISCLYSYFGGFKAQFTVHKTGEPGAMGLWGYGALERHSITLLGCLMHSRRRFYKAWLEAKQQPGIASEALAIFKFLYDKEESYREKNLTPEERKYWRDQEMAPSMEAIKNWCEDKLLKVLPSSTLGNALRYYLNEYEELTGFLKDGHYEMDNGWIERQIKRFAIGRKNWLFCDSVEGAKASSVLYSLALTTKLNGKNPFEALTDWLSKLSCKPCLISTFNYPQVR